MISFVFRWRLIENETTSLRNTHRVPLERASHGLNSVDSYGIEGVTPGLLWVIPTKHSGMVTISLLSCGRTSNAATRHKFPSPASAQCSSGDFLILVQVPWSKDLSVSFSEMSLVFGPVYDLRVGSHEAERVMIPRLEVQGGDSLDGSRKFTCFCEAVFCLGIVLFVRHHRVALRGLSGTDYDVLLLFQCE